MGKENVQKELKGTSLSDRVCLFLKKNIKECRERLRRGTHYDTEDGGKVEKETEKRPFPLHLFWKRFPNSSS